MTEFDGTLDILNEKGEEHGLKFKRGNTQYENKKEIYKAIFCRYKQRNIKRVKIDKATICDKEDKREINHSETTKKVISTLKNKKKISPCHCYYRFSVNDDSSIDKIAKRNY